MSTAPNIAATAGATEAPTDVAVDLELGTQPSDAGTVVEDAPGAPEPGVEQPESGTPTERTEADVKEDGRVLPNWLRELKASNPEQFAKAKGDFFDLRERRGIHATVKAAREEHELVREYGGREGIAKLQEDGQFFKTAANQFLKGDPGFVNDLWEEDPIAAALHVQPMIEAFRKHDPQGWGATICKQWEQEFAAQDFSRWADELVTLIQSGDKNGALQIARSFKSWRDSIGAIANKAEDPRVKTLLAERAKQREDAEKAEQGEFLKSYRTETLNEVVSDAEKVFDSFFKGKKLDAEDRQDLLRDAVRLANQRVVADEAFLRQRNDHLKAGNSESARRLTKARYAAEMTNAVKRVARRYGLKPNANANPSTPAGNKPPATPPNQGYVAVNTRPDPTEIDRSRTSNSDIIAGRAVLKNGRKVSWTHLKGRPS